ncbi:hypothetical protein D3C76_1511510 [compost metagenome]
MRSTYRLPGPVANMVAVDAIPQTTIRIAIQRRAPTILSITLLGIPQITYIT